MVPENPVSYLHPWLLGMEGVAPTPDVPSPGVGSGLPVDVTPLAHRRVWQCSSVDPKATTS